MLNINRILFLAEPANVRLQPHNHDATKFVLKSPHPECAAALCKSIGVEPGKQWRGSTYFITEVDKVAFMQGFAQLAVKAVEAPQPKALAAAKVCPECGGVDGAHWGYCPNHVENKAKLN